MPEARHIKKELKRILTKDFLKRAKNLRRAGICFNPFALIFFTRLAEFAAIKNMLILPSVRDLQYLFALRRELSLKTLDTLREFFDVIYFVEINSETTFFDDLLYVLQRFEIIQKKIDDLILESLKEGEQVENIYRILIKALIEIYHLV